MTRFGNVKTEKEIEKIDDILDAIARELEAKGVAK